MAQYVTKEQVLNKLEELGWIRHDDNESETDTNIIEDIITELTPKDVAPVIHSRWVKKKNGFGCYCENCNMDKSQFTTNYCGNCGAIIDKE